MVVHVFTAKRYHLVPEIAAGFATTYVNDAKQHIILNGDASLDVKKYYKLFSKIGFSDYTICKSKKDLALVLWKYRCCHILFHAGSISDFLISFIVGCRHVDWVCWGGDANKTVKSKIANKIRCFIYNRFETVITLMDEDGESISRDFGVPKEKIRTISYASSGNTSEYDSLYDKLIKDTLNNEEKPIVLLGNSPLNITDYIKMLPSLAPYSGKIRVQCMNHYSLVKDDNYYQLLNLGKELFGDDFQSNEDFYNYEDYIYYMNKCTIYICSNNKQTGLGAIYTCLQLGKKIFIHGKNLKWIKGALGSLVFDTDQILDGMLWEDFDKRLSYDERLKNLESYRNHRQLSYESWKDYLNNNN